MRRELPVVLLSFVLILILISPNILIAQPVGTEHSIIVSSRGVEIKPLVLEEIMGKCSCNRTVKILKKEGNRTLLSVKYSVKGVENEALVDIKGDLRQGAEIYIYTNGTKYYLHAERIVISSGRPPIAPLEERKRFPVPASRSLNMSLMRLSGNITMEYYQIDYSFRHPMGNMTVSTLLIPRGDEYISAFTTVLYTPAKKNVTSLELVNLSETITLSQMYEKLEDIAERLSGVYERGNKTVRDQLAPGYLIMARELRHLANTVKWMKWIDRPVLKAKAVISDVDPYTCEIACDLTCEYNVELICEPACDIASGGNILLCFLLCFVISRAICSYTCSQVCK
ncbi:hypothetical protein [Candidatus Methanodesulfokora washburnensis]|uniref:Uncharacterized protein n=1 Tax=Candidatus Methanodesulfokora washburnensis TaxID=2478471 RepID=A0A429GGM2_9CREN|nr:hypothetical protein [Candidatus Methanodesulfokores washburnensis]RSN72905.1 hypothetical protein D6D85_11970 [Candidatus Methanodesulfokores washburnensis]